MIVLLYYNSTLKVAYASAVTSCSAGNTDT